MTSLPQTDLVKVEDVKKSYSLGQTSVDVLKGVNFSLCEGEFVMVMGPSGSGKSTLLHLLAGLDFPTAGKVSVFGSDLAQSSDRDLSVLRNQKLGFIFQFYHLFPELTAYENVCLPALLNPGSKDEKSRREKVQKVDALFEAIGLGQRKSHRPSELSGGEQQRVAIARALVNDPKILLADEPTGNLDAASGEVVLELLEEIQKSRNLTILMVTHNPEFLKRAHRVLYLKDGRILS